MENRRMLVSGSRDTLIVFRRQFKEVLRFIEFEQDVLICCWRGSEDTDRLLPFAKNNGMTIQSLEDDEWKIIHQGKHPGWQMKPLEFSNAIDLGKCCHCGGETNVRNIMFHDKKSPTPGSGAGCVICGAVGGASSVLCDDCYTKGKQPLTVVSSGYPDNRAPIEACRGHHAHDIRKHPEMLRNVAAYLRWFDDSPKPGDPECICSVCGHVIEDDNHTRMPDGKKEARFHNSCHRWYTGVEQRRADKLMRLN